MFFLLSGLILLSGTCLRWFYSHKAAEKWLNKRAPFFMLRVIFVVSGMWLNLMDALPGRARVPVCVSGKGSGGLLSGTDARPRNTAHGGNHLLLQVKCLLKWVSQYGGSTQDTS